jgi:hypothetical protein
MCGDIMKYKKKMIIHFREIRHLKMNEIRIVKFPDGLNIKIKRIG